MCKIVAFTNTSRIKSKKHIEAIGNILLGIEKDGFGYAIQGQAGVYGEKTVKSSFKSRLDATNMVKLPIIKNTHSKFGHASTNAGPGIFHGRTSTNVKGLLNCHPMQRDNWHLIHNGVVTDSGERYDKLTQNDSEDVLHRLINGIDQVEKHLSGYYAFAAIDPDGNLHIGKDSIADLHMAWSPSLDSYIFATSEVVMRKVVKALGAQIGPIEEVLNDVYVILKGNETIHSQSIKPLGWTKTEARYANLSLGRSIGPVTKLDQETTTKEGWPGIYRDDKDSWPGSYFDREALLEREEAKYYQWKHEIENMDDTYNIYDINNKSITITEFRKMDHVNQEMCTIVKPDGTWLEMPECSRTAG